MKQLIKTVAAFSLITTFSFLPPKHDLVGSWIIYAPDNTNSHEYVEFKKDGTYNVVLPNGKVGEAGNYKLSDPVFLIKNSKAVCGEGYWGKYKISFYGRDSVSFAVIKDSCTGRRQDIVGGNPGLRRMKAK